METQAGQEGAKLISDKLQQPADTGQPVLLSSKAQSSILASLMGQSQNSNPDTLVIYVFSGNDPEYMENLSYFLWEGIQEADGCEYIIVLQQGSDLHQLESRPPLPTNARYMEHPNSCFDIGTVGWVLNHEDVVVSQYQYFVWLNSSVRGPFLPAYLRGKMHWTAAFTSRITDSVKLVGSTINCGRAYEMAPTPHVQTYVVATDQVGLKVLRDKGTVFKCHDDMAQLVMQSELGASRAILDAGYNLDCLLIRYQGLDWRDSRAAACNANVNPIQVKASMADAMWYHVRQAKKYSQWVRDEADHSNQEARFNSIATNHWLDILPFRKAQAEQHGQDCFDQDFYIAANKYDLAFMAQQPDPKAAAWQHFLNMGIGEGRPHRYLC
eukprot:jgi/Astpho2/4976/fgenesh1_pg.00070_%23_29_t